MDKEKFDLDAVYKLVTNFRNKRDWKKFHNPKNLAISISLEANELLEHFQWKNLKESIDYSKENKEKISAEIADILVLDKLFIIEVLCSETDKSFKENKEGKYPKVFEVFKFHTNKDFDGQITDILALTT